MTNSDGWSGAADRGPSSELAEGGYWADTPKLASG